MNRTLNSLALFLMTLLVFSSCTKENLKPIEDSHSHPGISLSEEEIDYCFENPDNPYEYVGVEHNAALDAIAASPDFGNLTAEEAHTIANQSVTTNLGVQCNVSYNDIIDAYALLDSPEPILEAAQALLDDGQISVIAFDKILQLDQIINDSPDPLVYGNSIIDLETQIMNEGVYTDDELAVLLGGASIARHSMCYWIGAGMDADNPWNPHMDLGENVQSDLAQERWHWWKKVKRIFKKVKRFVKKDIAGYKFAKKYVWIFTSDGWKQTVISVVVGVVYSFYSIWF